MKHLTTVLASLIILGSAPSLQAQGPEGKSFGFGIILGGPTGATLKFWTTRDNAFDLYLGGSYFGAPVIGGDYLWHFWPFNSSIANLYAGPGLALGLGSGGGWFRDRNGWWYRSGGGPGLGVRVIFGVNVMPRRTPLEIFLELGPMIGIVPGYGYGFDAAVGVRFYP